MTKIKIKHKVSSKSVILRSWVGWSFIGLTAEIACIVTTGGPGIGIPLLIIGHFCTYPFMMRDARKEADHLMNNTLSERQIRQVMGNAKTYTQKTELKNYHKDLSLIEKIVFGDDLTKVTTYTLKD